MKVLILYHPTVFPSAFVVSTTPMMLLFQDGIFFFFIQAWCEMWANLITSPA